MTVTLPNLLSVLRLALVPAVVIAILHSRSGLALVLMAVAAITDALDGWAARSLSQQSLLGAYLDPIADKLLLTAVYVTLSLPIAEAVVRIPVWVTVLVITRDVMILGLALALYLTVGTKRFPPTKISKANTVCQIAGVLLVLAAGLYPQLATTARTTLWLVAALTIVSGLQYAIRVAKHPGAHDEPPVAPADG